MPISRRMLTITRLLARFLRAVGPAHPSGRLNSIATTSLLQRMTSRKQRFWYTRPRTEKGADAEVVALNLSVEPLRYSQHRKE